MTRVDPYSILGVAQGAGEQELTAAYRSQAKRWHPDRGGGDAAARRMAEINEAHEILSNAEKRGEYDRWLAARPDRRTSDRLVKQQGDVPVGTAGAPVGPAQGSVVEFGRYSGWTLGQIKRHDPEFLEWLMRVPAGRQYREEIGRLLRGRA